MKLMDFDGSTILERSDDVGAWLEMRIDLGDLTSASVRIPYGEAFQPDKAVALEVAKRVRDALEAA